MPRASAHSRGGTDFGRVGLILAAKSGPPDHFLPRTKFFVTGVQGSSTDHAHFHWPATHANTIMIFLSTLVFVSVA